MQIRRALTFAWTEPDWRRLLLRVAVVQILLSLVQALAQEYASAGIVILISIPFYILSLGITLAVYTHFTRIVAMIARSGMDTPAPAWETPSDLFWRFLSIAAFTIILLITMLPLFCIAACPFFLLVAIASFAGPLAGAVVALTFGALVVVYNQAALSRYLVTESFEGGLSPANNVRTIRSDPGVWFTAAYVPIVSIVGLNLLGYLLHVILPGGFVSILVATIFTTVPSLYFLLLSFHLSGQAFYLTVSRSQPQTSVQAGA